MSPYLPECKIQSNIVSALSRLKSANAKSILNEVETALKENLTIQAIYKHLNELKEENVVIKQKDTYILSLDWANKLRQFSEQVRSDLVSPDHYQNMFERLRKGEIIIVKAHTPRQAMQHTMNVVTSCVHNLEPHDRILNYTYHALFPSEEELKPLMDKGPLPMEMYVYGDTPWDIFMEGVVSSMFKKYVRVQNYIPERFFFILGDIVIEKFIPPEHFLVLDDFVGNTLSKNVGDFEMYEAFKDEPLEAELHIYHDPQKAQVLYDRITSL